MITVLESPETRQTVFPLSVELYHEVGRLGLIGEDVELLEGVLFKKMSKSPLHQTLSRFLQHLLESAVPSGCFVDRECPITCARSEPEPDLAVFRGAWPDYRENHPATAELVIEISINTRQRGLSKTFVYAEAGVKECWIVEPEAGTVSVYTGPSADGYADCRVYGANDEAASTVFPSFKFRLADCVK